MTKIFRKMTRNIDRWLPCLVIFIIPMIIGMCGIVYCSGNINYSTDTTIHYSYDIYGRLPKEVICKITLFSEDAQITTWIGYGVKRTKYYISFTEVTTDKHIEVILNDGPVVVEQIDMLNK